MKSMFVLLAFASAPVLAQEVQATRRAESSSVERALEITLGAGYAQGFGIAAPHPIDSVIG